LQTKGVIQIVIGACLFGLIPFFVRLSPNLNLATIVFGRALFASIFALVLIQLTPIKEKSNSVNRNKDVYHLIMWTLCLLFAILSYFLSIKKGSVAIAGTMMGMHPIFVVLFSILFFKEKIFRLTYISCAIAIIGGVLILSNTNDSTGATLEGVFFGFASAFFLGLNFTYYLKYLSHFSSSKLVFLQNVIQLPILFPFLILSPLQIDSIGWMAMAFLGVLCTGLAYFLVYNGSRVVKIQYIGVLQMIENVIPVVLGVYLYSEKLNSIQFSGILMILFSAVLVSLKTNHSSN
jgi:drug/metabolite transporter (DMT)-like permease